jgi:hypothetical protein
LNRLPYDAKVEIFKRMAYRPSKLQMAIHKDTTNESLAAGGWRAGKSVVIAAEATPHCLIPSPRPYLIALIGPTYVEPRSEFGYIVEFLSAALPRHQFDPDVHVSMPKEGKCSLTIPAQGTIHFATVETFTAKEAESVRSFNADAVILCEAGGIEKDSFESIIGRTASTGGFILGSGTMESSQKWYQDLIKQGLIEDNPRGIRAFKLPTWSNEIAFPKGREDPKILRLERLLDPETFAVRIAAEPIRISGVALKQMTPAHIKPCPFDPALPVELWIDPGYTGAYAVLAVQRYDNQIRIIDEVYERFLSTPDIIEICRQREWWGNVDPEYPGVIDRAAKQKQAASGDSVLDVWFEHTEMWFNLTEQIIGVEAGLEQARIHLAIPDHLYVDPKCEGLLAECDLAPFPDQFQNAKPWHYRRARDETFVGDKSLAGADHSCTALIYGLVAEYGFMSLDQVSEMFTPMPLLNIKQSFRRAAREFGAPEPYGVEEGEWASAN